MLFRTVNRKVLVDITKWYNAVWIGISVGAILEFLKIHWKLGEDGKINFYSVFTEKQLEKQLTAFKYEIDELKSKNGRSESGLYFLFLSTEFLSYCKSQMERAKKLWNQADAVCFDVDSTVCQKEAIDELAKFMGKEEEISKITKQAMDGQVDFHESLKARLNILRPSLSNVEAFLIQSPPELSPGAKSLIDLLKSRNTDVFLVTGGFSHVAYYVADQLGIPHENVFSNKLIFDSNGNYVDFDKQQLTSTSNGKSLICAYLKSKFSFKNLVMIGDGMTDLHACPPADLFIGFGGNQVRQSVRDASSCIMTQTEKFTEVESESKTSDADSNASDISGSDAEEMENQLTLEQKEVALAAGLDAQQVTKAVKQSRPEKKARKMFSKMGLKQVPGIQRVCIRKSKNILFVINKPDVYKNPSGDTFIVFGEAKIEDLSQHAQQAAAEKFKMSEPAVMNASNAIAAGKVQPEDSEEDADIDCTGIEEKDIELVMSQANVGRGRAIKALRKSDNDIVNAIMDLTM
ncbi:Phosphoserine phosphatase [Trichinella papuae]|uniref:O-phosphoserine phosphohydrolase n=1 Tax=Trichinella papuae TaxID=268474 RepID=A0A0V1N7E5_9BILA|nr:Phosphoserine phosphatase [Trichinella papuae]